ncbi:het domain-containing protein, partial [Colletotrichum musicola]
MAFVYSDSLVGSRQGIRLLVLLPCQRRESPIECRLETVDLSANPNFEALSYVWGDPSTRVDITVNKQVLNVTASLGTALRHLRHGTDPRALWVDAVCIDQTNLDERNHQVKRMRYIYQHSSHTVVWLGEGDEETDAAMALLRKIDQQDDPYPFRYISQDLARDDLLAAKPGFDKIARRPWWTRMWTFQEFFVARSIKVLCGDAAVRWKAFDVLLPWIGALNMSHGQVLPQSLSQFTEIRNARNVWHSRIRDSGTLLLSTLLKMTGDRGAGEPRDHVFAVLGLVAEGAHEVQIDYKAPVARVYHDATVAAFQETGEDIL